MTASAPPHKEIRPPWTAEEVGVLNRFQNESGAHPFTCGNDDHPRRPRLVATTDGWRCPLGDCGYTQDWAPAFMTNPSAWPAARDMRPAPAPPALPPPTPEPVIIPVLPHRLREAVRRLVRDSPLTDIDIAARTGMTVGHTKIVLHGNQWDIPVSRAEEIAALCGYRLTFQLEPIRSTDTKE